MRDFRGNTSGEVSKELDVLHEEIRKNQSLKELAQSDGGKELKRSVMAYLVRAVLAIEDERIDDKLRTRLIERVKAWRTVLGIIGGGEKQLESIEKQLEYQLSDQ